MLLALELGQPNVDRMLRRITAKQFMEWEFFAEIHPFSFIRADFNAASIVTALWNIARDTKKHPAPFDLEAFRVKYGMDAEPKKTAAGTKQHGAFFRELAEALKAGVSN